MEGRKFLIVLKIDEHVLIDLKPSVAPVGIMKNPQDLFINPYSTLRDLYLKTVLQGGS